MNKKTITPVGGWIIVRLIQKKKVDIVVPDTSSKSIMVDKCVVYGAGKDVKYVKTGDEVLVSTAGMSLPQFRLAIPGEKDEFLKIKEEEIVGIIK